MQFLTYVISFALIPIILGAISYSIEKNNGKELLESLTKEHVILRMPKAYIWIGCICSLGFGTFIFLMIMFPNGTEAPWVFISFSLFILLGIYIILKTLLWKADVFKSEEYFCIRPFLKTYRIQYSDCVYFKDLKQGFVIKTEKKKFRVLEEVANAEVLSAMLTKHGVNKIK